MNIPNPTAQNNHSSISQELKANLITIATQNVSDILQYSIKFDPKIHKGLVVFDTQNELTQILTESYRSNLPNATFIDFDKTESSLIIAEFDKLEPGDLVVLLQSSSFRLDEFRIRIHLFNQKLKVIEHLHLYRNLPKTWHSYVNSLAYNPGYYNKMGTFLQTKLTNCQNLVIKYFPKNETQKTETLNLENDQNKLSELKVCGELEIPKLNTGNYEKIVNIGGTFPIGEVFTEAKKLENMNGSFWVWAFADSNFDIIFASPFCVKVENGLIIDWSKNAPTEFIEVIENVKKQERLIIREIGFGLNPSIDKTNPLGDITAFERIVGIHLSLGEKHSVYKKEGIVTHKSRFHIDLFLLVDQVLVDEQVIFENGGYLI